MEKEIATPDYYPLSLNALVNAVPEIQPRPPSELRRGRRGEALAKSPRQGLALRITGRDSRVPKHSQRFTEKFNLGRREAALICALLLRGPQTAGELRAAPSAFTSSTIWKPWRAR